MSINLSIKKTYNEKIVKNYVFFTNENFKIDALDKSVVRKFSNQIKKTLNSSDLKDKEFLSFNLNPSQKIILIKTKKNQSPLENEKKGAKFFNYTKSNSFYKLSFFEQNINKIRSGSKYFFDDFVLGLKLKSYVFDKYKTIKNNKTLSLELFIKKNQINFNKDKRFSSLIEGLNYTKDLVSEPGNVLHPDEYAKRLKKLSRFGLKITIYDQKKLKKMGMNALLGVGQGSIRGSYLVTMEWNGSKSKKKTCSIRW